MDYKSLSSTIIENSNVLNGYDAKGKKSFALNDLSFLRYYLILYYASVSPLHKREEFTDRKEFTDRENRGYSLYYLGKVAKQLRLDYDRTRTAVKIFKEGEMKGEVVIFLANDNYRYYKITQKGKKSCDEVLQEIETIKLNSMYLITETDNKLKRLRKYFRQ